MATKTQPCFKGCEEPGIRRYVLGQDPEWYFVPKEDAGHVVHLCDSCWKPAKVNQ